MADDNGFDVDKIKHGEFMDAKDRRYFEQYGSAMEEQAEIIKEDIKEDIKENYEEKVDDYIKYANEVYDDVMKRLAGNMNQYLVQGACLKCSKQLKTESVQNLFYGDSEIKSKADDVETNSALQILAARTENANGLPFANVTDTRGGLSGELLKGGAKEGEEEENQLNIVSFGNCGFLEEEKITDVEKIAERVLQILHSHSDLGNRCRHNGITKDRIKKGILEGIQSGKGTCYGCMVLNTEWENLPEEYDYAENTFDAMPGAVGIEGFLEGKQYFQFGGKDAINMMSMLFCRFGGGIINAEESGQRMETLTVPEMLWRDIKNMGYSDIATAAIMGNISWESGGYNVGSIQYGDDPYIKGVGIGLCQWTIEPRKQGLFQFASELGLAWDSYELQICYLEYELLEGDDFVSVRPEKMNEYTDIDKATEEFMWKFENPKKSEAHLEDRQERARDAMKDYGG